jgi:hypothetical protein
MNTKNMLEFITPSEDYLNEWEYTRAYAILSVRKFREAIDDCDDGTLNHEVLEGVPLYDSLRNLRTPNGWSDKDVQTVFKYRKAMIERGEEDSIHPIVNTFLEEALNKIIEGKTPDVAFKYKGEVSGENGLDETNPPKYIFQITNGLLNSDGASLHKISMVLENNEVTKVDAQQMRKNFQEKEMWRLQGYVNWRMEKSIENKSPNIDWTKGQKKNLKRYWGIEVK